MGSETALVGPWTVLAFSRYFDEMDGAYHTGAYNTATMALARYFPIAIAAYIVSLRIRDGGDSGSGIGPAEPGRLCS